MRNTILTSIEHKTIVHLLAILLVTLSAAGHARSYQSAAEFVKQASNNAPLKKKRLWLKDEVKAIIKQTLGHRYPKLRLTYWQNNRQTVWLLDEVGKERPITFGISIVENKIERIKVLAFRESRGGEIAMPVFEQQFVNQQLTAGNKLSEQIDGISGATMSVNAMKKVTKLALRLHQFVSHDLQGQKEEHKKVAIK